MSIPVAKQYILDFEQMGLGMFIHWGLYSQLGRGEWVFFNEKLDMNEYKKLAVDFTGQPYGKSYPVRVAKAVIK